MSQQTSSRRRFLTLSAGATAAAALGAGLWLKRNDASVAAVPGELRPFNRTSWALGTDVSLTVLHRDENTARAALNAAFVELNTIEDCLSIYRPHSQLSLLNRDGVLNNPHAHFLNVFNACQDMSRLSDGAFDATVQPLWELFFEAKKKNTLPGDAAIAAVRARVNWKLVDGTDDRIAFKSPGMKLTFNGVAQGYAADRVMTALKSHGIEHALADTGELESLGRKADGAPYKSGIQHPRKPDDLAAVCALDGRALATSGDYATTFSDDFTFNHIFNPATGRSPLEFASVSIVAPSGILADALSTTLFVLGEEKGKTLLQSMPKCDAYVIKKDGRTFATPGFPIVS